MNIDEENKAKEFYIKSNINGIHTPRTNMVEINYLDMLKLMHSYSQEIVKKLTIPDVVQQRELYNCECKVCGKPFDNKEDYYQHYNTEHN